MTSTLPVSRVEVVLPTTSSAYLRAAGLVAVIGLLLLLLEQK